MISPAAVFARDRAIQKVQGLSEDERKKLASATAGAASTVASWGLLQATLFWEANKDDNDTWIHDRLREWFCDNGNPRCQGIDTVSLPDFLVDLPTPIYRQLTADALDLLGYLKRFTKVAARRKEWPDDTG